MSPDLRAYLGQIADALGAEGALSQAQPGYAKREGQAELAQEVGRAIAERAVLVAEAGTGTGKTFAYLVPALLSGGLVVISTGTRTLQDQLYRRDLPRVSEALRLNIRTALLKGRSNYVCRYHLRRNLEEGRFDRREDIAVLRRIDRFAAVSSSGDRSEAPGIAEDAPAWSKATSTRDNCLGQECPDYRNCFVFQARQAAQSADVIVVNHHLFCADLALKDEGISDLLPTASAVIFDEAHQLPDIATQFFGSSVSSRQLVEIAREALRVGLSEAADAADWIGLSRGLEQSVREWRLAAGSSGRQDRDRLRSDAGLRDALAALHQQLKGLLEVSQAAAERGRELARLSGRLLELTQRLGAWREAVYGPRTDPLELAAGVGPALAGRSWGDEPDALPTTVGAPAPAAEAAVLWAEASQSGAVLHSTPLSLAATFRHHRDATPRAWVFVSATLAIAGDFRHFVEPMGLDDARCVTWESPFNYAANGLLYVPVQCGEPGASLFPDRMVEAIWPLIEANRGRAFLLCTSLRMVDQLEARIADRIASSSRSIELLVQGRATRSALLERFRQADAPVLIGSASFWEGVDVVGEQLSLVVIDKLPFAPPDDPVLKARSDVLRQSGGDPFGAIQLPAAAMALKQGAGRLIRSETDTGLLVICDERLVGKSYGRKLRASLPPMPLTRSAEEALTWVNARSARR